MKASDDAAQYVQFTEVNRGGCIIRPVQIIPAQPDTCIIVRDADDPEDQWEVPVVAWGVWDAFLESDRESPKRWQRGSGPMVYDLGRLVPADLEYDRQFAGIRIGNWRSTDLSEEWIEPKKEAAQ